MRKLLRRIKTIFVLRKLSDREIADLILLKLDPYYAPLKKYPEKQLQTNEEDTIGYAKRRAFNKSEVCYNALELEGQLWYYTKIKKGMSIKPDGFDVFFAYMLVLFWPFLIWFTPEYVRSREVEELKKRGYKVVGELNNYGIAEER